MRKTVYLKKEIITQDVNYPISSLIQGNATTLLGKPDYNKYKDNDKRFVFGIPLPSFQREFVWTQHQQIKLIESLFHLRDIGSFMVATSRGSGDQEFDGWLLDGQQRLTSIQNFVNNEFPIFDNIYYKDLGDVDFYACPMYQNEHKLVDFDYPKSVFGMTNSVEFKLVYVRSVDECKDIYNEFNFSGTPHTEEQRA